MNPSSQKYAALISYLGKDFCGWQIQTKENSKAPSIQETITHALKTICPHESAQLHLVASGRTDAGVHATGQVAHFELKEKDLAEHNLLRGLNTHLPPSVRILKIKKVSPSFHAQHDAIKKQYSYYYHTGEAPLAALFPLSVFDHRPLDFKLMNQAIQALLGEHDFLPFQASDAKPGPTTRTLYEADVTEVPLSFPGLPFTEQVPLIRIRVVGSGFLKHMVRGIAGTLHQIGLKNRSFDALQNILNSQDRSLLGPTAPAQGLWLERVWYPELVFDK